MKLDKGVPVQWIAEYIGATIIGSNNRTATGINEIHKVTHGDVSFVDNEKYFNNCLISAATIIIINKEVSCPDDKTLLLHPDPFSAYVQLVKHFRSFEPSDKMISDSALIGEGTHIQPGTFVGNHGRIA